MVASKRGPLKGVPFWRAIVPLPGFFSFVTCQVTVDRLGIRQYYHTFTTLQHLHFFFTADKNPSAMATFGS